MISSRKKTQAQTRHLREREMRKRRETEISEKPEEGNEIGEGEKGFFACYLLCSLSPRHKGHTYIGFTINPCRRIRQHNGEITCGAWRTKRKRPWEMILCIYGFPTNVSALQFEWAWQHPTESLAVRKAAASFKSLSGIANKIKLAYTMLNLPVWQSLNLTVNFFSTKYKKHSAGCPSLPGHMKVQVCPMDELPCYMGGVWPLNDDEDENEDGVMQDKEMDIPVNDITKFRCSIENTAYEEPGCIEHDGFRQPMEPLTPREDHRVPLCVGDCSITSSLDTVETVEDGDPFGVIGDGSSGLGQSTKQPQPQTPKAADNDRPPPPTNSLLFPPEVEVINVSTPLSDYIVRSCRKKKKSSTVFPEFIDLTKSPIFIQL